MKYNTSQKENDFDTHINKTQELETTTDPIYITDESTTDFIFTDFISQQTLKSIDLNISLENSSELINSFTSLDFETFSVFPKETTIDYVTISASITSYPSYTLNLKCSSIFFCIVIPTFVIQTIQILLIILASEYRKLLDEMIIDGLTPIIDFHNSEDGEVNLDFHNDLNLQDIDDDPPANLNENPQEILNDDLPTDHNGNSQTRF